jgi:hypothetical protein
MKRHKKKQIRAKRKGSVLALTAVMVVILTLLGLAMVRLGSNARLNAIHTTNAIVARTAADAGITQAVSMMNIKLAAERGWDNTTLPKITDQTLPGANANFSFNIVGEPKPGFMVTSTGNAGFAQRVIHSSLKVESLWFGIGVKQDVAIHSKTIFETIPAGSDFTIQTNSTSDNSIDLFPNTFIPGDIAVGPGGVPDNVINVKSTSIVTGDKYASDEEIQFPDVVPPPLTYKGNLPPPSPSDPNLIVLTTADSGIYDEINLGNGQKLHFTDGQVTIQITGDVRIHNGAELRIMNNPTVPSLKLYLDGDLQADNGSIIDTENHLATGTRLKIYGTNTCESIIFMNSSELSAAVYAPYAHMELKNSAAVYGAFTGESLELKNSGQFYYDVRLLDIGIEDDAAYMVGRWWEE